ncbi:MAG: tyrosine-type recombinase/integrase [Lentisphaerae bacterium]|nr:tyrosine-type recombinase/integrase [Lentisphaerota bacterium]
MRRTEGYLYKRGSTYWIGWTFDGKRHGQSTGTGVLRDAKAKAAEILAPFQQRTKVEALTQLQSRVDRESAALAEIEDATTPPLPVVGAWDAYQRAGNRREIGALTMRNYAGYWSAFKTWLASAHPDVAQLRQVTFACCEEYKAHLVATKITGRTFNAHRAFLRAFWNVLSEPARTDGNPWAKLAKRDEHSQGRRPLTVEELRHVCQAAEGGMRLMLALGLYLGCRMGDAACMEWGSVDMVRRTIRYTPRKTARKIAEAVTIPMHPELYGLLAERPQGKRRGAVCPDLAERYARVGATGVSDLVQGHFAACGLATTEKRIGSGIRKRVVVGFHSLRHATISLMREAGAAQSVSMAIAGHSSREVHQLYTHTDEAAMRRAVLTIPGVMGDALALPPANLLVGVASELTPLATIKASVRALAEKLTAETVETIRKELLALANSAA